MERLRSLEVHEESDSASVAAEEWGIFVIEDDIHSPAWANPLPPGARILSESKVLKYGLWAYNQVSLASQFGTDSDVMFFFAALGDRQILRKIV